MMRIKYNVHCRIMKMKGILLKVEYWILGEKDEVSGATGYKNLVQCCHCRHHLYTYKKTVNKTKTKKD